VSRLFPGLSLRKRPTYYWACTLYISGSHAWPLTASSSLGGGVDYFAVSVANCLQNITYVPNTTTYAQPLLVRSSAKSPGDTSGLSSTGVSVWWATGWQKKTCAAGQRYAFTDQHQSVHTTIQRVNLRGLLYSVHLTWTQYCRVCMPRSPRPKPRRLGDRHSSTSPAR
jgi:hypothetical protein